MKDTLKKLIIIALLSVSFIAIFNQNIVFASGVYEDEETYRADIQENIEIDSSRGKINVTYMVPRAKKDPMGLVVMCHGYTGAKEGDGNGFIRLGKILAQNGIAAITIDFPGCGKSPQPSTNYSLSNMRSDIDTAIQYMKKEFDNIDTSQIGICGHSMGGRVASLYLDKAKVAAIWAPANGSGANSYEFLERGSFSFDPSPNFKSEMESSDPNGRISGFSGPLLIAFDSDDRNGDGPLSPETVEETQNAFNSSPSSEKEWIDYNDVHNININKSNLVKKSADLFCNYFVGHDAKEYDEYDRVTIEDIVYNRVPILDINVFSDTAGGEDLTPESPAYVIRELVATWYVAVRNAVAVVLALLLLYTGIRMAIATIASDQAQYKEFFIGWLKSVVILFTIHYVMLLILELNDTLVSMFNVSTSKEGSMYDTIRTRAYDLRASVGFSGMLMYIALVFMFFRFAWLYVKRTFTVLILIILAPFIAGKYAFDSASGKRSRAFSEWLYQFGSNVLIQTVHALLYASIVGTSLDLASESLTSFIIAMMFLNFMLSADKIALKIFKFENRIQDLQKPFDMHEDLSGVFYAYGTYKVAKGAIKKGANYVGYISKTAPLREATDKIGEITDNALSGVDKALEKVAGTTKSGELNLAGQILYLRRAGRRKGQAGDVGKRTLKLKVGEYTSKFTSAYKFIKNDVVGVGGVILAIPLAVLNPGAGIGLFAQSVKAFRENAKSEELMEFNLLQHGANILTLGQYKNRLEERRKNKRKHPKIEKTVKQVIKSTKIMEQIEEKYDKLDDTRKKEVKAMLEAKASSGAKVVRGYMDTFIDRKGSKFGFDFESMSDKDRHDMADSIITRIALEANIDENTARAMKSTLQQKITDAQFGSMGKANSYEERKKKIDLFTSFVGEVVDEHVIQPKTSQDHEFAMFIDALEEINRTGDLANKALLDATDNEEDLDLFDVKDFVDNL